MRILLTGFEPFGTSTVNPSQEVVRAIEAERSRLEDSLAIELATAVLPVDLIEGPRSVLALVRMHEPDAVISMGEAARRSVISVERIAINLVESTVPDNAGRTAESQPVSADAPAAYFTTLPVDAIVQGVQSIGIGAERSRDAGTCLCNQVMFATLHELARTGRQATPAGFIHLPWLPEQVAASQASSENPRAVASMSLDIMTKAIVQSIAIVRETTERSA